MTARLIAVLVAAALTLAGCAQPTPSPSPSSTRTATGVTIGLTYIPNIQFAPFYVAEKNGYFEAEGVSATLRHHGAQEGLFTALASGQEDFVIAGGDEMAQAASQGMDLVAVASYYRRYPVVAIVPDGSAVRTASDIKGRRVGVPMRSGETWLGLLAMLKSAGLTEADITVVEVGFSQQAALKANRVDVIMGFSNNDLIQFGRARLASRAIPLTSGEPPLVSIQLITTRRYLTEHPDAVRGVANAMVAGMEQAASDPAGAVVDSAEWVPTLTQQAAAADALATLEATTALFRSEDGTISGRVDEARFTVMVDFLKTSGLVRGTLDSATLVAGSVVTK